MSKSPEHATATITETRDTSAQMIAITNTYTTGIEGSPNFVPGSDMAAVLKDWNTEAAAIAADQKAIVGLEAQLAATRTDEGLHQRRWKTQMARLLAAINLFCDGSADKVQSFSFKLAVAALAVLGVPQNLRPIKVRTPHVAAVLWDPNHARHGYVVQYATDPAAPATYSPQLPWTRSRFRLIGQASGAKVYFRVAASDPNAPGGVSDWTAWVMVTVR